jgi:ribosomal protein S18 acetylase RimI-like enzyme
MSIKINDRTQLTELKQKCDEWLNPEGVYSVGEWIEFYKYCDIFTYTDNNKIIGFLVVVPASIYQCDHMSEYFKVHKIKANKVMHIMLFATSPDFRGKGIGTALFKYMYQILNLHGITHFLLAMRKQNVAAKRFYIKQGFVDTGMILEKSFEDPIDDQIMMVKICDFCTKHIF